MARSKQRKLPHNDVLLSRGIGYAPPCYETVHFQYTCSRGMFSFISCERHNWEDSAEGHKDGTKNLFPKEEKKHDDASMR